MWFPTAQTNTSLHEQTISPIKRVSHVDSLCKGEAPITLAWTHASLSQIKPSRRDAISCTPLHPSEPTYERRRWNPEPRPRSIFLISCHREFYVKTCKSDETRTSEADVVKVKDGTHSLPILWWGWVLVHWLADQAKPPFLLTKSRIPVSRLPEADANSAAAVRKTGSHSSVSTPTRISVTPLAFTCSDIFENTLFPRSYW